MSQNSLQGTPYERFLRQNLEAEKKRLDYLSAEYARAWPIKKVQLKREIDLVNQNIKLLSADLDHYHRGLDWLREPSKERDEKAESLKPVPIEAITGQAPQPAKSASAPSQTRPVAPTIGRPVGSAPTIGRPVGQPIGSQKPSPVSQPVEQQKTSSENVQATAKPAVAAPRVGAPQVGKPIGTPVVGKPIGTRPQAPRVGTPIGTPSKKKEEETDSKENQSEASG